MKKYRFAATGYIIFNNRILLIKHPKLGVWLPVGGKVDEGESPGECFKREVREEVGLDVEIIKLFEHSRKVGDHQYLQLEDVKDFFHLDFIYYAKASTDKVTLIEKIKEAKWFSFCDFLQIKNELFPDVSEEMERIYSRYCEHDPFQIVEAEFKQFGKLFKRAVVVNHSDGKTEKFLNEIKKYTEDLFYVEKSYSGNEMSRTNISSLLGNDKVVTPEQAKELLLTGDSSKDVVFDISGVVSSLVSIEKEWKGFVVEDTANGLTWIKSKLGVPQQPIFSVAYSRLKKSVENPHVAEGIFSSVIAYCHANDFKIHSSNILLVGYGSIGSILAEMLASLSSSISIFDKDYSRLLDARARRFNALDTLENIAHFDVIISSTGTPDSMKEKELVQMKDGVILVNCSTKQWEFDRSVIEKYPSTVIKETEIVNINNKKIFILNKGFPINFWNERGTYTPPILSTFACMLEMALHIQKSKEYFMKLPERIYEISEILPKVEEKYLKHYFLKESLQI